MRRIFARWLKASFFDMTYKILVKHVSGPFWVKAKAEALDLAIDVYDLVGRHYPGYEIKLATERMVSDGESLRGYRIVDTFVDVEVSRRAIAGTVPF